MHVYIAPEPCILVVGRCTVRVDTWYGRSAFRKTTRVKLIIRMKKICSPSANDSLKYSSSDIDYYRDLTGESRFFSFVYFEQK